MAGTLTSLPLSQQFDINGQPLSGALLYFFQVGAVATPEDSFQDFELTLKNPWPLTADQYGRIPMFYLADGQVHVRLTDQYGVVILDYPTMQVIGPSVGGGGGGGGPSIDPTTIAATGDVKYRATSEVLTGWVKANGQSIGAPSSGATQRANADTQNLYVYLWGNFINAHCPVAGGRGTSGLADFSANKPISLPDWRGRALIGLDDMGNAAAGIILAGNVTSGGGDSPTTPAASGGESNHTLVVAEAPVGQITLSAETPHSHAPASGAGAGFVIDVTSGGTPYGSGPGQKLIESVTATATTGITATDHAGGGAHNNMSPFVLGTIYIKL